MMIYVGFDEQEFEKAPVPTASADASVMLANIDATVQRDRRSYQPETISAVTKLVAKNVKDIRHEMLAVVNA